MTFPVLVSIEAFTWPTMVPRPSDSFVWPSPKGMAFAILPMPPFWKLALNRTASSLGFGLPNPRTLFTFVRFPNSVLAFRSFRKAWTTLSIPPCASFCVTCAERLVDDDSEKQPAHLLAVMADEGTNAAHPPNADRAIVNRTASDLLVIVAAIFRFKPRCRDADHRAHRDQQRNGISQPKKCAKCYTYAKRQSRCRHSIAQP